MKKFSLMLICCFLLAGISGFAEAADRNSARDKKKESCQLISSSEAAGRAQARTGGKVVNVRLQRAGKRSVYKVRVLVGKKRIKNVTIKACR
ncbi:hypothetical protein FLL45_09840 [Aliikangiella marina]|uniref:PepSY domain-containing protein n=1 Tax=Aliikangiella marina TaxID=1712262 RepID=A0A545TDC4_9GAMM|nr:hypothetical protein [Aliikangiella marina]TQV75227.1 hypothetical protein FLL45_09840 [Aliikangiella marina]